MKNFKTIVAEISDLKKQLENEIKIVAKNGILKDLNDLVTYYLENF